ncbi:hypothetical protein VTK73DRAFT_5569 [Phialemonium thermophilum]|uniref:AA1-like domain-containing protein n=1 Tax=Phialemonium thermophilum TaxID=223376 RepID=A0ABR3XY39_9PEZI
MFAKALPVLTLLAQASTLVSAEVTLAIGVSSTLIPSLPGGEPSIGCQMFTNMVSDGQGLALDGSGPQDDCPAADVFLFCRRWGCPFQMTFGNHLVEVTVESDNADDKSITVTATGLNSGTTTVTCPWNPINLVKTDSGSLDQLWQCDISAIQG